MLAVTGKLGVSGTRASVRRLLDLGAPVHCDIGRVHLPCFPARVAGLSELAGSKPAEQCWLTAAGLQAEFTPLYGNTPFNNWLIVATRV